MVLAASPSADVDFAFRSVAAFPYMAPRLVAQNHLNGNPFMLLSSSKAKGFRIE